MTNAFMPLTRVTPYLGLGYLRTHTNGFTESGTTALNVQAMDADSFTTTLGARAAATFQIGATAFRPELRAAWQHEFLDQAATRSAPPSRPRRAACSRRQAPASGARASSAAPG